MQDWHKVFALLCQAVFATTSCLAGEEFFDNFVLLKVTQTSRKRARVDSPNKVLQLAKANNFFINEEAQQLRCPFVTKNFCCCFDAADCLLCFHTFTIHYLVNKVNLLASEHKLVAIWRTWGYTECMKATPRTKKTTAKTPAKHTSTKVDIHPNRVTLAVSTLAVLSLVLFALIAVS